MNTREQLALLTAMDKVVKERIKQVRAEADESLMEAYEEDGFEKAAIKLNGQKVGEHIVTFNKEGYAITDEALFAEFALDYGMATIEKAIRPHMLAKAAAIIEASVDNPEDFIDEKVVFSDDWELAMNRVGDSVCYMDSGLVVPGVEYRPKTVKGTMVRGCKPEEVMPAVAQLGGIERLLLGGAE